MRTAARLAVGITIAGCVSLAPPPESAEGLSPEQLRRLSGKTVQGAIAAYNDGRIERASAFLEAVLGQTRESDLARIKATAHFYMGAVAWDHGDRDGMELHVKLCRHIDAAYEPDWTFISPSLRKYFESLK